MKRSSRKHCAPGQILVIYAIVLPVLLVAMGIAIDFGFAYVARAGLSKAADAAALAAMRNINLGQATAIQVGQSAFNANYFPVPGNSAPTVNISFATDAASETLVNVTATSTYNTAFLRLLPGLKTLTISTAAQVTRPKLIMSLILDRSGSMNLNGGAQALPSSVSNFLSYFDNNIDNVAEISYAWLSSVDVPMQTGFQGPINNAVSRLNFNGGTYSTGGLNDGLTQIDNVPVVAGENVVKVAVFFTDGWANTVQDKLTCSSSLLNFGGCSPPEEAVGWCGGVSFVNASNGRGQSCGSSTFPSQAAGGNVAINTTNVSNDAMFRALKVAEAMRQQNITVFSIGLGDKISQTFLQQIANDPASPTFNAGEPEGEAVFAPSSSQLQGVFQTIAAEILLRISQ
jgi:Flp pilus assembly protein TadG